MAATLAESHEKLHVVVSVATLSVKVAELSGASDRQA
jgi:hypothetical protein